MKKRVISLMTSILMIIAMMASAVSLAAPTDDEVPEGTEEKYDITLHKIVMDSLDGWPKSVNEDGTYTGADGTKYDGSAIADIGQYFGQGAKILAGVHFEIYKVGEENVIIAEGKTKADGTFDFTDLPAGDYIIKENKEKSKLEGLDPEDADKILANQAAVPVKVTLPAYKANGDKFTTIAEKNQLHVYPKNTIDGPEVDKDIDEIGKKDASFDFNEEHTWIITAKIPEGIEDYKVFKLTDVLQNSLTYKGKVKVSIVDTKNAATGVDLVKDTDYTLTEPAIDAEGGTLIVDFSSKIANLVGKEGKYIKVEFTTTINENAIMGKDIPNSVDLEYGHDPQNPSHKKPGDDPKVNTGGKKFVKKDKKTGEVLAGAMFIVKNSEGKVLTKEYTWIPKPTGDLTQNTEIVILNSGADGTFEIKGLKYGEYFIEEIKAPNGYASLKDPIKFIVDKTSYITNPEEVVLPGDGDPVPPIDQEPQTIENMKIDIPETGGMGTILFTVVGLALMTVAFISLRKKNNEL